MEVALLSDLHFGVNKFDKAQHKFIEKFLHGIVYHEIINRNIEVVFDLGDTFDRKSKVSHDVMDWSKKNYFNFFRDQGVQLIILRGNHNPYVDFPSDLNDPLSIISSQYKNVSLIDNQAEVKLDGKISSYPHQYIIKVLISHAFKIIFTGFHVHPLIVF